MAGERSPARGLLGRRFVDYYLEELELVNARPIDPDLLAIFLDGKYVEVKEDNRLRPACIYLVIRLHRDGKKKVLGCLTKHGRENLEGGKPSSAPSSNEDCVVS